MGDYGAFKAGQLEAAEATITSLVELNKTLSDRLAASEAARVAAEAEVAKWEALDKTTIGVAGRYLARAEKAEAALAASEARAEAAERETEISRREAVGLHEALSLRAGQVRDLIARAEKAEAALAGVRNGALREAADRADTEKRTYHSGESDFDHGAYMASENIKAAILALTTTAPGGGE